MFKIRFTIPQSKDPYLFVTYAERIQYDFKKEFGFDVEINVDEVKVSGIF